MNPVIAFAVSALMAGRLLAATGSMVLLKTKVTDVPPKTRVIVEIRARYAVLEIPRSKHPSENLQPTEQYDVASPDVFQWEFTADGRGAAPPKNFVFHFPVNFDPAPEGLVSVVSFPVRYRIVCPEGACRSRESAPVFPTVLKGDVPRVTTRCLELRGDYGVTIGIT